MSTPFALVQNTGSASTLVVASQSTAFVSNVTAGDLIVVAAVVKSLGALSPAMSVTDSQSNQYIQIVSQSESYNSLDSVTVAIYAAIATSSGSLTVSVGSAPTGLVTMAIYEFSFRGIWFVVASSWNSGLSNTPDASSLSDTPLVVAGFDILTTGLTYSVGSGYTLGYSVNSSSSEPFLSQYASSLPGSFPVSMGLNASSRWLGVAASFDAVLIATDAGAVESEVYSPLISLFQYFYGGDSGVLSEVQVSSTSLYATDFATDPSQPPPPPGSPAIPMTSEGELVTIMAAEQALATDALLTTRSVIIGDQSVTSEGVAICLLNGDAALGGESMPVVNWWLYGTDGGLGIETGMETISAVGDSAVEENASMQFLSVAATAYGTDEALFSEGAALTNTVTVYGTDYALSEDPPFMTIMGIEAPTFYESPFLNNLIYSVDFAFGIEPAQGGFHLKTVYGVDFGTGLDLATFAITVNFGYYVYSNTGIGDPINYVTPIATILGWENVTWTSTALSFPGTWKFGVRAFDACGIDQNLDCSIVLILDGSGIDITNQPIGPVGLRGFALAGGQIKLEWYFTGFPGPKLPTGFHVYWGASGPPDYTTIRATVSYGSGIFGSFTTTLSGFTDGVPYTFGVRSFNLTAEEKNTLTVTVVASSVAPSPPVDFSGSLVSES